MIHSYRAYGLDFASNVAIPGLAEARGANSYQIQVSCGGQEPAWASSARNLAVRVEYPREGLQTAEVDRALTLRSFGDGAFFELDYAEGVTFLVDRAATYVHGSYSPPLTIEDLAACLVGPICGFVLRRRAVTVLHAGAVNIDGNAVLLCGPSGAGKSTTAASLALRGFPVICEDMAALRESGDGFEVEPGYPRICLWPDSVSALLGNERALPALTPNWEKCFLPLDGTQACFDSQRRPVGAIYLIDSRSTDADAPKVRDLASREALLELVQNTYMNWLLDREQRAAEFDSLARLVERTPIRRVTPHSDAARISELCDVILEDTRKLMRESSASNVGTH